MWVFVNRVLFKGRHIGHTARIANLVVDNSFGIITDDICQNRVSLVTRPEDFSINAWFSFKVDVGPVNDPHTVGKPILGGKMICDSVSDINIEILYLG